MSNGLAEFMAQFRFDPERALYLGVERERLLTREVEIVPESTRVLKAIVEQFPELQPWVRGERSLIRHAEIVPESARVLKAIVEQFPELQERFAYEFSACVLEDRIGPCRLEQVRHELEDNEAVLAHVLGSLGLASSFQEVAPTSIPFVLNAEKSDRYRQLSQTLPLEVALAVCRIIGTHVHVGMPDHDTALRAYNRVIRHWRALTKTASLSGGRRERLYSMVKAGYEPIEYSSWKHFYEDACEKDFAQNPKDNWAMIRLSTHGTVETRVFGATSSIDTVCTWAWLCQELCAPALNEEG